MGKQSCHSFDMSHDPEMVPYEHVAFNVWGLAHVQTIGGKSLMLVATDNAGAECTTWYLSNKATKTTVTCLEAFDMHVENQ